jgi:hypothetical protein
MEKAEESLEKAEESCWPRWKESGDRHVDNTRCHRLSVTSTNPQKRLATLLRIGGRHHALRTCDFFLNKIPSYCSFSVRFNTLFIGLNTFSRVAYNLLGEAHYFVSKRVEIILCYFLKILVSVL